MRQLHPAPLRALDLRAGAAMVVAALAADGVSEIDETSHIERGYENIVEKLQALGADIRPRRDPHGPRHPRDLTKRCGKQATPAGPRLRPRFCAARRNLHRRGIQNTGMALFTTLYSGSSGNCGLVLHEG